MHIKQIIIQGFKSYKDQTVIEPFSPGLNVIVGRNGSGKSNFFAAIRFVLSDAYTQLGREERQALLHEGSGSAVMSAYVEVIFDNSDERFPTGKPELVLRRTIGVKKDEYSLDRKNATKSDVMNLLESAGFSRSNPYYIVPQGRVTTLTNMKDGERLSLLKEVAGTQVYEARRSESLKIMQETDNKRTKIDETLIWIKDRLDQLEEEKEELRKYQDADREHRCLQYTILNREKIEFDRALQSIEDARTAGLQGTDQSAEEFIAREQQITEVDRQIKQLNQQLEFLLADKRQLDEERKEAQRDKARVELDVQRLVDGQSAAQQAKSRHDKELGEVQRLVKQRETELGAIVPDYTRTKDDEDTVRSKLEDADAQRKRLFAKQSRSSQFTTKHQRDEHLRREIEHVSTQLATRKAIKTQTQEEIVELNNEVVELEDAVKDVRDRIEGRSDDLQTIAIEIDKAKETHDQLQDRRRELWREENRLRSVVDAAQRELVTAEQRIQRMVDRTTWQGIKSVRRIAEQHGMEGVHGTLFELFDVNETYATAVETIAGQSLFHYVVDTDDTATKLLEILNKERSGRVTFMPLNRLHPRPMSLPETADSVPMIKKLKFDKEIEPAIEQVFGKTIICPTLPVAAQYARSHSVTAITPQGDRADKRGALQGGYHDPQSARLAACRKERACRESLDTAREKQQAIQNELQNLEHDINKALTQLRKLEQQRDQNDDNYVPLRQQLRGKSIELLQKRERLDEKERTKSNIETEEARLAEEQEAYEAELKSEFRKALTSAEEQQLNQLTSSLQEYSKQLAVLTSKRADLESTKNNLELELRENLQRRLEQLNARDIDGGDGDGKSNGKLQDMQRQLKRSTKILDELEQKVAESEQQIEKTNSELSVCQSNKATLQQEQETLSRNIERHHKRLEKSLQRKALISDQLADTNRSIRDLGVLPEEGFRKYERWDSDKAMKRLKVVKESLKKYSHVNKKAFEQYNNFTKQRDMLTKRRGELDSSQKSIEELIDVLDLRKDEAIERTFKQVSKEFATVFEKLVPAGQGRLIMQRKTDKIVREEDEEEDEEAERSAVENYIGVGISVSFNSKHDDQQRIQQLSGGQKSLCALALVFAIQRCDPAPFYLFDEIDANLDAQYRTAVAQMLKTLSEQPSQANDDENGGRSEVGGQFICTTFRPEMVLVAEKCYGVTYTNKTSSIDVVDREAALEFVDDVTQGR